MTKVYWVTQTALSYTVGEPVYRITELEPQEFEKRVSISVFPVVEKSAYDKLLERIEKLTVALNLIQEVDDTGTGGYIEDLVSEALTVEE
jgi:hypothetical protein